MAKRPTNYISYRQLTSNPKLNGQPTDYQNHTDPKYIGPGKWHDIHQMAWRAQNKAGKDMFKTFMTDTCENFPCSTCKTHCTQYMLDHPMKNYEDVLVEVGTERAPLGLFVWAWKFHNTVNARLHKPQMSWDTCYNMYSGKPGLVCSKACLHAEGNGMNGMNGMNGTNGTNGTDGGDINDMEKHTQQIAPTIVPTIVPIISRNYYGGQPVQQVRQQVPLYPPVVQPVNNNINNKITSFQQLPGFRR